MNSHILNHHNQYALVVEIDWIVKHVANLPPDACVVMIGAGPGVMALACFEGNPDLHQLHVVELNTVYYMFEHLQAAGIPPVRIMCHQGYSWDVGRVWDKLDYVEQPEIDFLIVDGDHTYEAVRKDISSWIPHMKSDGVIFFHDYLERENGFSGHGEWKPSGVARAVNESGLSLVEQVGISMVCKL